MRNMPVKWGCVRVALDSFASSWQLTGQCSARLRFNQGPDRVARQLGVGRGGVSASTRGPTVVGITHG